MPMTFTIKRAHQGDGGRIYPAGHELTAEKWTQHYRRFLAVVRLLNPPT
jgi:hypothetical protein